MLPLETPKKRRGRPQAARSTRPLASSQRGWLTIPTLNPREASAAPARHQAARQPPAGGAPPRGGAGAAPAAPPAPPRAGGRRGRPPCPPPAPGRPAHPPAPGSPADEGGGPAGALDPRCAV